MTAQEQRDERPCLHCLILELIEDYFAEYPPEGGEPDMIGPDEVISAIARVVAELTYKQDGTVRQQMLEKLMREAMEQDAEYRREDATGAAGSVARH
jgi:hypothetical protein